MMADYPSYLIDSESFEIQVLDGSERSRADSGRLRIKRLWSEKRYEITFTHPVLTKSELDALQTFYDNNLTASDITFTNPMSSEVYSVSMTEPPSNLRVDTWGYYAVDINLEGTLNG